MERTTMDDDTQKTNLFVRNLASRVDDNTLRVFFEKFGTIVSSAVMRNIHTGQSRGTGFVRFANHEAALAAFNALNVAKKGKDGGDANDRVLCGKPVSVKWAKTTRGGATEEVSEECGRKIFVRNVPLDVTELDLMNLFSTYGTVARVDLHRDTAAAHGKHPASSARVIAFVFYEEDGVASQAVRGVHATFPFPSCDRIPLLAKLAEGSLHRNGPKGNAGEYGSSDDVSCCQSTSSASDAVPSYYAAGLPLDNNMAMMIQQRFMGTHYADPNTQIMPPPPPSFVPPQMPPSAYGVGGTGVGSGGGVAQFHGFIPQQVQLPMDMPDTPIPSSQPTFGAVQLNIAKQTKSGTRAILTRRYPFSAEHAEYTSEVERNEKVEQGDARLRANNEYQQYLLGHVEEDFTVTNHVYYNGVREQDAWIESQRTGIQRGSSRRMPVSASFNEALHATPTSVDRASSLPKQQIPCAVSLSDFPDIACQPSFSSTSGVLGGTPLKSASQSTRRTGTSSRTTSSTSSKHVQLVRSESGNRIYRHNPYSMVSSRSVSSAGSEPARIMNQSGILNDSFSNHISRDNSPARP